jgi:hypothetical protein
MFPELIESYSALFLPLGDSSNTRVLYVEEWCLLLCGILSVWALANAYRWLAINFRYIMEILSFASKFTNPCLIKGREGGEDFHGFLLVILLLQVKLRDVKRLFKTGNLEGGHPLVLL